MIARMGSQDLQDLQTQVQARDQDQLVLKDLSQPPPRPQRAPSRYSHVTLLSGPPRPAMGYVKMMPTLSANKKCTVQVKSSTTFGAALLEGVADDGSGIATQ